MVRQGKVFLSLIKNKNTMTRRCLGTIKEFNNGPICRFCPYREDCEQIVKTWRSAMDEYTISGQKVEVTDGGNFSLHIDSIFKSAGMIFNFPQKCSGIGINQSIVEVAKAENRHIIITIGNSPKRYIISPEEIIRVVNTYGSVHKTGNGVNLFVIPLKTLKPLGESELNKNSDVEQQKAFDNKMCPKCGSNDLDFQNDKFYVVCGGCGKIYTKKNFVKR
jgi:ribosomal protein S27AE